MKRKRSLLVLGVVALTITLCQAKSKPPLFVSPDFNPKVVDRIDIFVVDLPNDPANDSEYVNGAVYGAPMQSERLSAGGALIDRGYNLQNVKRLNRYDKANYPVYNAPITAEMISNPSKVWLEDLSNRKYFDRKSRERPSPGQWIMVLTIDELGSKTNVIKGPGRASLSMYLFDRDQGTLLWHDHDSESAWGGLLGNVMTKGSNKQYACASAATRMVRKLPKHKK